MKFEMILHYNQWGESHSFNDEPDLDIWVSDKGVAVDRQWFKNDQSHRENGPSRNSGGGHKEWKINGILHRIDGPARITSTNLFTWAIMGREYGTQTEPPEAYIERLKKMGIEFVRGSDEV
jgi:hypothetical protein